MFVHGLGVGDLFDVTVEHDGDAVAHRHRFFLVVRDEDECDSKSRLQQLQFDLHLLAQLAVECAERFVEQQDARPVHQSARDCDTLLLAARHLARSALCELRHLHHVERLGDALCHLRLGHAFLSQTVRHVFRHRHVREECVVLEHRVDVALVRRNSLHVFAGDADESFVGLLEPGKHAQRGGLAATARAEQREKLAGFNLEVDLVDGDHLAVALRHIDEFDRTTLSTHRRLSPPCAETLVSRDRTTPTFGDCSTKC